MKIVTATLALTGLLAVPDKAEAGHEDRFGIENSCDGSRLIVRGRASCGCPHHLRRIFLGHDRCGRPVFEYIRIPLRHRHDCRHSHRARGRMHDPGFGARYLRDYRVHPPVRSGRSPGCRIR